MRSNRWGLYTENEVQRIIDHYAEWLDLKHIPFFHVRLMDLDVAKDSLPRKIAEAVLVHGLYRMDSRDAGSVLHISHTAVRKRYRQGFDQMVYTMNGSDY